jgi:excisionase family DNA binding protein
MDIVFLTPSEAAPRLGVVVQTVRRWCREGRIENRRLGGRIFIPETTVIRLTQPPLPPMNSGQMYYSVSEAATMIGMRADKLRFWCRTGVVPCRRVGRCYQLLWRTVEDLQDRYRAGFR